MESTNLAQRATSWPAATKEYFEDLKAEMRRVTWPTWKQVRATTTVVIVAVFAFAAYFRFVDYLMGTGVTKLFEMFSK